MDPIGYGSLMGALLHKEHEVVEENAGNHGIGSQEDQVEKEEGVENPIGHGDLIRAFLH